MDEYSTRHEKTKILPLRWFANASMSIATRSLSRAFDLQEEENYSYRFKFHSAVWHYLSKPYDKWGTYYSLDIEKMKVEMSSEGWDDYDKDGKPYWEKWDKNE